MQEKREDQEVNTALIPTSEDHSSYNTDPMPAIT